MTSVLTNMCMLEDAKGRVLVQHRLPKPGNPWAGLTFPGGHVEAGESIVESMIREFKEETGLTISQLTNCGYVQWYNPVEDSQYIIFCFRAAAHKGRLKSSSEGKVSWMALDEFLRGPLAPNMEKYLEVFTNPSVLQTYGEATCWDEVIQDKAKVATVISDNEDKMQKLSRREFGSTLGAVAASAALNAAGADKIVGGEANVSKHLTVAGRVNLGSFYTPAKYVERVAEWLKKYGVDKRWTITDLSCGYGAFFEMSGLAEFSECCFVGNDVDHAAVKKARDMFPSVKFFEKNALYDVSRKQFSISEDAPVAVVGNPPYNDVTSQINQDIKTDVLPIDEDIKSRDLGISSLLAYNKLRADLVAVLHPLSYLIKKANFSSARDFFSNYEMLEHVIFSSQEFAGTSKTAGFPVIVALYRRKAGCGLAYEDVKRIEFKTVEGDVFSLNGFDYVTDRIEKYPHKTRYKPEILFYTMRDINALKRSRTFVKDRIPNAVDINPDKLAYYCYIDCFKRYADVPYWMGNFNVPFVERDFELMSRLFVADAKHHHPEVFGEQPVISGDEVEKIREYIQNAIRK